jgi:hypothetical protein
MPPSSSRSWQACTAYPFHGLPGDTELDFALLRVSAEGVMDSRTELRYTNALNAQLDAVHSVMELLSFGDVDAVVIETGWPWTADDYEVGRGTTPLMPNADAGSPSSTRT